MTFAKLALDTTAAIEAAGIDKARAGRGKQVAFAIVLQLGVGRKAEKIKVVTTATLDERTGWFELLGLPKDLAYSNDANYGVAFIDDKGEHIAGPNLVLAKEALANLKKYGKIATNVYTAKGETNPKARTPFAFSSDLDGWRGGIEHKATHEDRLAALELYGLCDKNGRPVEGITMGLAWRTPEGVTIATGSGTESPIQHILHAFCAAQNLYEDGAYPFPLSEII